MSRTADDLLQLLDGYLPPGFHEWTFEHRPDLARFIDESAQELRRAVFVGDQKEFAEAIRDCSAMYLQAVKMFEKDVKRALRLTYSGS